MFIIITFLSLFVTKVMGQSLDGNVVFVAYLSLILLPFLSINEKNLKVPNSMHDIGFPSCQQHSHRSQRAFEWIEDQSQYLQRDYTK